MCTSGPPAATQRTQGWNRALSGLRAFKRQCAQDTPRAGATAGFIRLLDAPQGFANSVPAVWEATNPELAVVRLHGRNAQTWNARGDAASDLADDTAGLTVLAADTVPGSAALAALAALVRLQHARRHARHQPDGTLVTLAAQDRSRWVRAEIVDGRVADPEGAGSELSEVDLRLSYGVVWVGGHFWQGGEQRLGGLLQLVDLLRACEAN